MSDITTTQPPMDGRLAAVETSQSQILDVLKSLQNNISDLSSICHQQCLVSVPEMKAKAKCLPLDIISSLPPNIIETILCLVPLRDAVRTSILSKKWRYSWVKIPKLAFYDKNMFDKKSNAGYRLRLRTMRPFIENKAQICKVLYAIYEVLLRHQGPILDFTLDMQAHCIRVEIDEIIDHVSRRNNTIKKFKLALWCGHWSPGLPASFFSLHQLTDIDLVYCNFENIPTFSGFGNLTSLSLIGVKTRKKVLIQFLSNCPILQRFHLSLDKLFIDDDEDFTIIGLFKCLPMVQHFITDLTTIEWLAENGVPRELPTALIHLKYLCISSMTFVYNHELSFLALLTRSSPNLEKISLDISHFDEYDIMEDYYSGIWLEHLKELEMVEFGNSEPELEFVKCILANSPMLKKVSLWYDDRVRKDEEMEIFNVLLGFPRASPLVDFIVTHFSERTE